jgi:hypothetical protein
MEKSVKRSALAVLAGSLLAAGALAVAQSAPTSSSEGSAFLDVREAAGIRFRHDSTQSEEKYYIETMGSGVAWIDYDQDGLLDLYFVQQGPTQAYQPPHPLRSALYRNNGDGTFSDVTDKCGVALENFFGMGAAVGDFDNDGFPDLYVYGWGGAFLFHNQGGARFADVTERAGVGNQGHWGGAAGWFDYDRDGKLDLIVGNYLEWAPAKNPWCGDPKPGYRGYCHPNFFKGERMRLFRNKGDGTFADVSEKSGVGHPEAKALGMVLADLDNDDWPDIFVANDSWPNFLFLNNRDGTFRDVSYPSGVATSEDGLVEAGMGTDAADVDGDGWLDIYVTHLDMQLHRLYHNNGDGTFDDYTYRSGIGRSAYLLSGVASKIFDFDNDGWNDIFQTNGAMLDNIHLYHVETAYEEPKLMFCNRGRGRFEKCSEKLGRDFMRPMPSRGAAAGDYDNDGDLDVIVINRGDYPQLLRNEIGSENHWLNVLLLGTESNRDGVGARLKLVSGNLVRVEQRKGGMSYMSSSDPRVHFGLGSRTKVDLLEIRWPSGARTELENLAADQIITVQEGAGVVPRAFPLVPRR